VSSNANQRGRGSPSITVFGRRAVEEAIVTPHAIVERVAVSVRTHKQYRKELRALCAAHDTDAPEEMSEQQVAELSGDPRNDQGVAARIRLTLVTDVDRFVEERQGKASREPVRLIGLDNVTNPQNIGMIVRSALGAGMSGVLWPSAGSPWVSGLVIKASAGTVYRCPIVRCPTLVEGLWTLRAGGYRVFGLAMDGVPIDEHDPPHRAAYLVGAEATGLSDETLAELDERVSIPMANDVESLNAAVAAALVCFRVARAVTRSPGRP
jgi:23S rRNA (guanosine2251-2'-O)-methyltransferase